MLEVAIARLCMGQGHLRIAVYKTILVKYASIWSTKFHDISLGSSQKVVKGLRNVFIPWLNLQITSLQSWFFSKCIEGLKNCFISYRNMQLS